MNSISYECLVNENTDTVRECTSECHCYRGKKF